ncbi:hypothetical protein [Almyronema epifaneia]|uniref:MFS transporter n=1 Tax=Almyronema epifaneia S1 TaxID=2991925 RepID=A0ABW6ID74_9CYAN
MQTLFSLMAGLIMAFAFQLLLTNLGIALGLSVWGWVTPSTPAAESAASESPSEEATAAAPPVTHWLGLGVTLSLTTVLFLAALLAAELSQMTQPRLGAIFGVLLWATYLLLLTWLSSTTLFNLANSVFGLAARGIRQLWGAIGQAKPSSAAQTASTSPEALKAIAAEVAKIPQIQQQLPQLLAEQRQQLLSDIREQIELSDEAAATVVDHLPSSPPSPTESSAGLLADLPDWRQLLRAALNRLDLSDWDIETLWQNFQRLGSEADSAFSIIRLDAEEYVSQAPAWSLQPEILETEFAERLYDREAAPHQVLAQLQTLGRSDFVDWLQQRSDLSAAKVSKIADQLAAIQTAVQTSVQMQAAAATAADWRQRLTQQLRQLPLDQFDADDLRSWLQDFVDQAQLPLEQVSQLLAELDSTPLTQAFESHRDLSQAQQSRLTSVWQTSCDRLLAHVQKQQAEAATAIAMLQDKLIAYFRYTHLDKLSATAVAEKLRSLLDDPQLSTIAGALPLAANALDWGEIEQAIARRQGMTAALQTQLTDALRQSWQADLPETALAEAKSLTQPLADYLNTVDWSAMSLADVQAQILHHLSEQLSAGAELDIPDLLKQLNLPQTLKAQLERWLPQIYHQALKRPRRWAKRVSHTTQTATEQLTAKLIHYWRYQAQAKLTPSQIGQDLSHLFQTMAQTLPTELSDWQQFDQSFWQQALAQRPDLDPDEQQQILTWLSDTGQSLQQHAQDWTAELSQRTAALSQRLNQWINTEVAGTNPLDAARQQLVTQLSAAQQTLQNQAIALQQEIQAQTEAARRQMAIAAWWLFWGLLISGVAAGGAGWLAVLY